jgi:DNA-binding NarL/FixJ family response regulator
LNIHRVPLSQHRRIHCGLSLGKGKHYRGFSHLSDAALSVLTLGSTPMPKSVLVVDDNAFIRQVLCRVFKSEAGFDVCGEAENGQDAIEKARALHPDLIVMDLSMPVMNGIDATRALKTLMPMVPVIVFSEYSDVFSEKEARSAGISAMVSKSEHVAVLIDKAHALLFPAAA